MLLDWSFSVSEERYNAVQDGVVYYAIRHWRGRWLAECWAGTLRLSFRRLPTRTQAFNCCRAWALDNQ